MKIILVTNADLQMIIFQKIDWLFQMKPKIVFVMIDGLSDVSISSLNNKTPLQYANVPNMDFIAKNGLNGFF